MISVSDAGNLIFKSELKLKEVVVDIDKSIGYYLAENILADRDFPPFDRVAMDGIAIKSEDFHEGKRSFKICGTQYAGHPSITINDRADCIEIMTGASMPPQFDTVIRYEDIKIQDNVANVDPSFSIKKSNLHSKGQDTQKGCILASRYQKINTSILAVAATCGYTSLRVIMPPQIAIVTTGDELVDIDQTPLPYQIRKSNSYAIEHSMRDLNVSVERFHLPDNKETLEVELKKLLLNYDIIILSGGVSKGKADFVPECLEALGVSKIFHKVKQKPGKPLWFGKSTNETVVFGLPGNPVSSFLCLHKYVIPWVERCLSKKNKKERTVILEEDVVVKSDLTFFQQVSVYNLNGRTFATPIKGNGSGDLFNLSKADGFIEIPEHHGVAKKGDVFKYIKTI